MGLVYHKSIVHVWLIRALRMQSVSCLFSELLYYTLKQHNFQDRKLSPEKLFGGSGPSLFLQWYLCHFCSLSFCFPWFVSFCISKCRPLPSVFLYCETNLIRRVYSLNEKCQFFVAELHPFQHPFRIPNKGHNIFKSANFWTTNLIAKQPYSMEKLIIHWLLIDYLNTNCCLVLKNVCEYSSPWDVYQC